MNCALRWFKLSSSSSFFPTSISPSSSIPLELDQKEGRGGGGEKRLSLQSMLEERDDEGFLLSLHCDKKEAWRFHLKLI